MYLIPVIVRSFHALLLEARLNNFVSYQGLKLAVFPSAAIRESDDHVSPFH
jgi:hypothetical protein